MSSGPERKLPPKKDVFLALLEGPSVFIHLDPRKLEVEVPAWFKEKPQLVLQVGNNMAVPIPDLRVEESGVRCTLSFNRAPFACHLPWVAVYALVGDDGKGMIWWDDVPQEVAAQMPGAPPRLRAPDPEAPALAGAADAEGAPAKAKKPRKKAAPRKPKEAKAPAAQPALRARAQAPEPPPQPEPAPAARPATSPGARPLPGFRAGNPAPGRKPKRELPSYLRVIKLAGPCRRQHGS